MKINTFSPFWEEFNMQKESLNIILIAHVQEPRGYLNSMQIQCASTERFSLNEFNEIYQGIVKAGFFVQSVYYNELDFISSYIAHPKSFDNCLIYNLSRNGIGDSKKTAIPAFCDLVKLKYTSSAPFTLALCRNKYYFSKLLTSNNIPTPKSWLFTANQTWQDTSPPETTLVIRKPCSESASQGITFDSVFEFSKDKVIFPEKTNVLFQEYIDGDECEVPVFRFQDKTIVLPPVGIDLRGECILSEDLSAQNQYDFYLLEQKYPRTTINTILLYAEKAFELLQMDVYGRIDFRIDSNKKPYIMDVSTTPYTTMHSSFAYAFNCLGFSYHDIYQAIISSALSQKLYSDKN